MLQKADIVGKRIAQALQTPWSEPAFVVEGIGPATYSTAVYVLDDGLRFAVSSGEVVKWAGGGRLVPLEAYGEPSREFAGVEVIEVVMSDDPIVQVYIVLANRTVLGSEHYVDLYGTRNLVCGTDTLSGYDAGPFKTYWEGAEWLPPAT